MGPGFQPAFAYVLGRNCELSLAMEARLETVKMITVSVCCNDPDNGNFDGHVSAIEIHGIEGCDVSLEPRTYPSPLFRWLDNPPKWHDARETMGFKVARFRFACAPYKSWYGNWCWDAVKMSGVEVLRLCRVLCQARWSCSEAGIEFAQAWDMGHQQITRELLHRALRPDDARHAELNAGRL